MNKYKFKKAELSKLVIPGRDIKCTHNFSICLDGNHIKRKTMA